MNKNQQYLIVIIILIIIIVVGVFMIVKQQRTALQKNVNITNQEDQELIESEPLSLEDRLKALLAQKYSKPTEEVEVAINQETEGHVSGNVVFAPGGPGNSGYFFAAQVDGEWQIVADGNAALMCSQVEPYNFPVTMINECVDETGQMKVKDQVYQVFYNLVSATQINFSPPQETNFSWQLKQKGKISELTIAGQGIGVQDVSDQDEQAVEDFFKEYGFEVDKYNVSAGTISGSTGYQKDDLVCVLMSGVKGYKEATGEWTPPEPDKKEVEVMCGDINNLVGVETIETSAGKTFSLVLASNPTTGYNWQVDFNQEYLELVSRDYQASSDLLGAGGEETFVFKALETGETEINFSYLREWEEGVAPIEKKIYQIVIE